MLKVIAAQHYPTDDTHRIDTGRGHIALSIFEDGVTPPWHIIGQNGNNWPAPDVSVETERPDGTRYNFSFVQKGNFLESVEEIPEPHEFMTRVKLEHGNHTHNYVDLIFQQEGGYQDAHELVRANGICCRFADRDVTTAQIAFSLRKFLWGLRLS